MDKRNQMENPFFDPDKPGSIFVGMDRYHQYSPHQPRNALTFIQKGDADSLFRKFLIDNIKEAECCPYIPDTELLRFDLANMRQVPPVDTHTPFEEYISKELLPYFQEHCIPPAKRISLRDAVYTYKYKNEPDGGILKKYLMQEPAYLEFRLQQQEKRTLYRCQPRYTFPLKVVENDFGYLIFSGNEIGRNGFRECIRYITDHYFDPHYDTGHLAVYDSTFMDKNLVPLIDAAYKPCKPMELDYSFDFYPASYIGLDELPKEFIDSLKPVCYHSMEATAGDFIKFATDWHFNKDTQVSISRENHDIYRLLTVMRNGYMNIHEQPFTYFNELLPYAKEFEKVTQVKSAGEFDTGKFKRLSTEIRKAADGILKRDFDVRGHRSLENMLNDSTVTFTVGSRKLNEVQKTALASGYALYLPENNKEATWHLLFCKADFEQARIKALGLKSDQSHSKEERLQSFVINHIEKFLNDHGRQIIGWDEILEGGLAPNATVMSWRGEKGGIEAAKQKHDVIMTPNTYLYFDYYQAKDIENEPFGIGGYLPMERVYSYEPMPASLTPEEQKYIKGVQAANRALSLYPSVSTNPVNACPPGPHIGISVQRIIPFSSDKSYIGSA